MIRRCRESDFDALYSIINDAACAYKGIIPPDRWNEPYMSREALRREIESGVEFWGYVSGDDAKGELVGVMGVQDVKDVTLLRHAYVRTAERGKGIGGELLEALKSNITKPALVGTWKDAVWAIRFYEKHGFKLVSEEEKNRLLRKYWSIPERQVETSVVLGDERFFRSRNAPFKHLPAN